ncbi:uncharacterized protein LOC119839006 [Zerene cesonia]|uniref:uncharacterized protein LOC119839006 n=1 Tax=Zerene cesonia TaxID=33412 RepID=UPI0018E53B5B|nr:uncharacterized protein LOC119839006 [Zerene cesonia]
MSNYAKLRKLDAETLQKLTEGPGPADECLCSLFAPETKRSFAASVKKAFGFSMKRKKGDVGGREMDIPFKFSVGGAGASGPSKEVLKRHKSCGKCGCDDEHIVLKHSYANIRITTPDVTSFCPCPTNCLPDKDKIKNNIKVVVERAELQPHASANVGTEEIIKDDINSEEQESV